jgi:hypothetical protein
MVINHLGTNHADEITLSPGPIAQDVLPMIAGNGSMPQPVIEPLTKDLTRHALDALGIPNSRDEDGDWFTVIHSAKPVMNSFTYMRSEGDCVW